MKFSLILPIYNEQIVFEEVIEKYIDDLENLRLKHNAFWEIIAVDDGSTDRTKKYLLQYAKQYRNFKVIRFDGRYGKQAAITAGFEFAFKNTADSADFVFVADMDILNPGGILTKMYEFGTAENAPIVHGYREFIGGEKRKASWNDFWTRTASRFFIVDGYYNGKVNVALYNADVAEIMASHPTKNKYMRTMDNWVGYEPKEFWYPSNLEREELILKTKELKERHGAMGGIRRDGGRENSSAKWQGLAFFFIGLIASVFGFLSLDLGVFAVIMFSLSAVCLAFSLFFFLKSVLLKRIGFVSYRAGDILYSVEKVLNK